MTGSTDGGSSKSTKATLHSARESVERCKQRVGLSAVRTSSAIKLKRFLSAIRRVIGEIGVGSFSRASTLLGELIEEFESNIGSAPYYFLAYDALVAASNYLLDARPILLTRPIGTTISAFTSTYQSAADSYMASLISINTHSSTRGWVWNSHYGQVIDVDRYERNVNRALSYIEIDLVEYISNTGHLIIPYLEGMFVTLRAARNWQNSNNSELIRSVDYFNRLATMTYVLYQDSPSRARNLIILMHMAMRMFADIATSRGSNTAWVTQGRGFSIIAELYLETGISTTSTAETTTTEAATTESSGSSSGFSSSSSDAVDDTDDPDQVCRFFCYG